MLRLLRASSLFRFTTANPLDSKQILYQLNQKGILEQEQLEWLKLNLQGFDKDDFLGLLRIYTKASLPCSQLASSLRDETFFRFESSSYRQWLYPFLLSRLNAQYTRLDLDLIPHFQRLAAERVSGREIMSLHVFQVSNMLSAYLNIIYPNKLKEVTFPTLNRIDIFDITESVIFPVLNTPRSSNYSEWYNILRVFILADKGSEDFRRALEKIVLINLPRLMTHTIVDLPYIYKDRTTYDYFYVAESVAAPYIREVVRRSNSFSLKQLGLIAYRQWWSFGKYGVYYNPDFTEVLKQRTKQADFLTAHSPEDLVYFTSNIITYVSNLGMTQLNPFIGELLAVLLKYKSALDDRASVQVAHSLSRMHNFNPEFWEEVYSRLDIICNNVVLAGYLYSSLLLMRFVQPELYKKFLSQQALANKFPAMIETWKKARLHDLSLSKQSFQHKVVEDYLNEHNMTYVSEHYDEYYIDIALPEQKIALEICGTMHYILPQKTLNGKTAAKKFVLEQLGWNVIIIPFFTQGVDSYRHDKLSTLIGKYIPEQQ